MRSTTFLILMCALQLTSVHGQECACESPSNIGFVAGHAGPTPDQLYPFDRQAPWLHGQYQRVPSYAGYSSFRPYNYRHVAPQAHMTAQFGVASAVNTSQQFNNRNAQNSSYGSQQNQSLLMPAPRSNVTPALTPPVPRTISALRAAEPRR